MPLPSVKRALSESIAVMVYGPEVVSVQVTLNFCAGVGAAVRRIQSTCRFGLPELQMKTCRPSTCGRLVQAMCGLVVKASLKKSQLWKFHTPGVTEPNVEEP